MGFFYANESFVPRHLLNKSRLVESLPTLYLSKYKKELVHFFAIINTTFGKSLKIKNNANLLKRYFENKISLTNPINEELRKSKYYNITINK